MTAHRGRVAQASALWLVLGLFAGALLRTALAAACSCAGSSWRLTLESAHAFDGTPLPSGE